MNKLPEGVGKKIVEALKQQTIEINEIQDEALEMYENQYNTASETNQEQNSGWNTEVYQPNQTFSQSVPNATAVYDYSANKEDDFDNFEYYEKTTPSIISQPQPAPVVPPVVNNFNVKPMPAASHAQTIQPAPTISVPPSPVFKQPQRQETTPLRSMELVQTEFETPANVEVLRRLISQLPAGVTRQTGAQIIRQTMEAMGLSINNVLTEAQMVQENLGNAVRDSVNTIEEYKNNIKILETKIQNYRKQADQLGELINLFILSEPKR